MAQHDFDPYELLDALRAGGDVDLIRECVERALRALIKAEATEQSWLGCRHFGASGTNRAGWRP